MVRDSRSRFYIRGYIRILPLQWSVKQKRTSDIVWKLRLCKAFLRRLLLYLVGVAYGGQDVDSRGSGCSAEVYCCRIKVHDFRCALCGTFYGLDLGVQVLVCNIYIYIFANPPP